MIFRRLPSWSTWPSSPFRDLELARHGVERLFDSLAQGSETAGVFPAINVSEDAESIYVRSELPGFRKEDLDINVENDTVTIAGERKMTEDRDVSYHRREREWGRFRRSLSLNSRVDANHVQARYNDGILTVVLPKAAEARPRQITVQSGS